LKELETVKADPELLGVRTMKGGKARPEGGGGESDRNQISHPSRPKYTKTAKKRLVSCTFWLINAENAAFCSKVLNKI
jgi:hypothetical protein